MKIETLQTKVNLLKNSENSNHGAINNEADAPLISLTTENNDKPTVEESPALPMPSEVTALNNKIEKMEQLLNKYKESLKIAKDKNSQMTLELQTLSNEIENKNKQILDLKIAEEHLSDASKKIKDLNDSNEELQNRINSFDFSKTKEISTLEMDLQKANEENTELRSKIEVFTKREEENAISLAENKLSIHKELESKEAEIKSLKDALSVSKQEVLSLKIVVDDYKTSVIALEEDKTRLGNDSAELANTRVKIDEMNSQLQEISKRCQYLEQLKAKADEEHNCLQLQIKQETAEKLAMIDRNMYLETRNTQLCDENTKKSAQITKLEGELLVVFNDKTDASAKDEAEVTDILRELNMWKEKCEKLESEIQEEREELVKLQTEIEKLLVNHELIQSQNLEFRSTIANVTRNYEKLQETSEQRKTKVACVVKTILQEISELRNTISLTSNETLSCLNTNKEYLNSFVRSVDELIRSSVQSEQNVLDLSNKLFKITKDYEEIQKELTASHAAHSEILAEKTALELELTKLNQNLATEEIVLKDKITNDYKLVLESLQLAKNENKILHEKILIAENETENLQSSLMSMDLDKKELNEVIFRLKDQLKLVTDDFENVTRKYEDSVSTVKSLTESIEQLKKEKSESYQDIQELLETEKSEHSIKTAQLNKLSIENKELKEKVASMDDKNMELTNEKEISSKKVIELEDMVRKSGQSVIIEKEQFENEKKSLSDAIKAAEINHAKIMSELNYQKQQNLAAEENISRLNAEVINKSGDCDKKLTQINELEGKILLLSEENINLKSAATTFNLNVEKLETEINEIKNSHAEIELEKNRLNDIIEKLESQGSERNSIVVSKVTQTEQESAHSVNAIETPTMFENKWVLENKETAMVNTAPLNLKTNAQEDIIEQYTTMKINYESLKDDNRRLNSDVEGLQSYLSKISKENSLLNDKLREVIASEHSMDNYQVSNELKLQLESDKEKINDLMRENSLLIEENLELKDQINSQSYAKLPEMTQDINNKNENIKEKYDGLLQTSSDLKKRYMDLEQIHNSSCSNIVNLQEKNEKLKRSNEKLERRLDEALVSLRHLHSLSENTELEYLKNILYEYLTGTGTHSLTLAKVLAAIVKFDDMQTQLVLQKEKERQGFVSTYLLRNNK